MINSIKNHPYRSMSILVLLTVVSVLLCTCLYDSWVYYTKGEEGIREEKGELVPGGSSGLQEIASDIDERHIYTYEGMSGETIRIYATTPSNVFLVILVYAPGIDGVWRDFIGDLDGYRGGDAEIIETLPVDGTYEIHVDMADFGGKYEIQVDIIE